MNITFKIQTNRLHLGNISRNNAPYYYETSHPLRFSATNQDEKGKRVYMCTEELSPDVVLHVNKHLETNEKGFKERPVSERVFIILKYIVDENTKKLSPRARKDCSHKFLKLPHVDGVLDLRLREVTAGDSSVNATSIGEALALIRILNPNSFTWSDTGGFIGFSSPSGLPPGGRGISKILHRTADIMLALDGSVANRRVIPPQEDKPKTFTTDEILTAINQIYTTRNKKAPHTAQDIEVGLTRIAHTGIIQRLQNGQYQLNGAFPTNLDKVGITVISETGVITTSEDTYKTLKPLVENEGAKKFNEICDRLFIPKNARGRYQKKLIQDKVIDIKVVSNGRNGPKSALTWSHMATMFLGSEQAFPGNLMRGFAKSWRNWTDRAWGKWDAIPDEKKRLTSTHWIPKLAHYRNIARKADPDAIGRYPTNQPFNTAFNFLWKNTPWATLEKGIIAIDGTNRVIDFVREPGSGSVKTIRRFAIRPIRAGDTINGVLYDRATTNYESRVRGARKKKTLRKKP